MKQSIRLDKKYTENGFDIFEYVGRDYGFTPIKIKDSIAPSLQYAIDNATLTFYPGSARIIDNISTYTLDTWPDEAFINIEFNDELKFKEFMKLYIIED